MTVVRKNMLLFTLVLTYTSQFIYLDRYMVVIDDYYILA